MVARTVRLTDFDILTGSKREDLRLIPLKFSEISKRLEKHSPIDSHGQAFTTQDSKPSANRFVHIEHLEQSSTHRLSLPRLCRQSPAYLCPAPSSSGVAPLFQRSDHAPPPGWWGRRFNNRAQAGGRIHQQPCRCRSNCSIACCTAARSGCPLGTVPHRGSAARVGVRIAPRQLNGAGAGRQLSCSPLPHQRCRALRQFRR